MQKDATPDGVYLNVDVQSYKDFKPTVFSAAYKQMASTGSSPTISNLWFFYPLQASRAGILTIISIHYHSKIKDTPYHIADSLFVKILSGFGNLTGFYMLGRLAT